MESRKYSLPPRAQFCATGIEAELRGGAEKNLGQKQSAASLCFGYKGQGPKGTQNERLRDLLECLRAKRKGRK